MPSLRTLPVLLALTPLTGCDMVMDLIGGSSDPAEVVAPARQALEAGELPDAATKYQEIVAAKPDVVDARVGLAYTQLLAGKLDDADRTLDEALMIEGITDAQKSEISLRRAIVALRKGDLDGTRKHGEASGLPAGQVLAGEVYLADAEAASAVPLFEQASQSGSGSVRDAAKKYLEYLNDPDRAQLAEATALWALGQREEACETAEDLIRYLPQGTADRDQLLLLWAGRAVASGKPGVAEGLLDEMAGAPDGQVWRVQATRALVAVANGDLDSAAATFEALSKGGAPEDGMRDAIATAAAISNDADFARRISQGMESDAIARGLHAAGATSDAKSRGATGTLSRFLESQ
jgi:tetratricopeptide (TPR) repeat protein